MNKDVDIVRARIALEFLMLPYVTRAALLKEFGFPGEEPHTEFLPEAMDTLTSEGRLDAFMERVSELYGKQTAKNGKGGVSGAKVMVELGMSGGIDALPAVREPIPVICGSVDDAISLAFAKNTPVAVITDERPADCPSAIERMDELRKAAEPLRKYLIKYGDPHTRVIVTQYGATETQDERHVTFDSGKPAETVKRGRWEKSDIPNEEYVCSVCGGACWYYGYNGRLGKSRYCPNCGARMEGVT